MTTEPRKRPPPPKRPPPLPRKKAAAERRGASRVYAKGSVRVTSPRSAEAKLVDISKIGMLLNFTRAQSFEKGQELNVQFQLPGSKKRIQTRVEIVRRQSAVDYGVRFLRLDMEIVGEIESFIERSGD
ncbi:MAG: PilZ domain-containing protein [Deltaproteobacteria bacterium]|nr:PilZ domain-containing protein [Deltaproteobacteria bacterium]